MYTLYSVSYIYICIYIYIYKFNILYNIIYIHILYEYTLFHRPPKNMNYCDISAIYYVVCYSVNIKTTGLYVLAAVVHLF